MNNVSLYALFLLIIFLSIIFVIFNIKFTTTELNTKFP